jgi:anti-sigma-K factor RskA
MTDAARHNEGDRFAMPPHEMFDLLADRAAFGLDDDEAAQLDALLGQHGWVRDECLDEVAAMLAVSLDEADAAPMPEDVAARISAGVHAQIASEAPEIAGRIGPETAAMPTTAPSPTSAAAAPSGGAMGWLGWVAAAAAIAVAVMVANPTEPARPQNRAQLVSWIDQHPSAVQWDWAPGLVDPDEDATGLVTFDPETQEGYMLIKGLEPNDPKFQQYQLWIWDQEREPDPENPAPLADNVHPVDGGVFDVNSEGEAVIPIEAKLIVGKPYLFAITVERPGGVAKSGKEHVPLIAAPPSDA